MIKILYFLMVGFAFTALQVGTAEAVKDCSGLEGQALGECMDANEQAALNNNEGNQSGGDAGAGAMQNNSGAATPTGAPGAAAMGDPAAGMPGTAAPMGDTSGNPAAGMPGTPAMGDPAVEPSLVDRFKGMLGLGTEVPPTGAAGENLEDPCMLVDGPDRVACYAAAPGNEGDGPPPIDPRSGQPFTQADEATFQKYADECEATKGLLSEGSTQELVAEGFTRIQVEKLCKDGPEEGHSAAAPSGTAPSRAPGDCSGLEGQALGECMDQQ